MIFFQQYQSLPIMFKNAVNFLLLLSPITIVNSQSANITIDDLRVLKEALNNASDYMQVKAQNENIAIFIGTTKSGKSTLINFLMDNPLIAVRKSAGKPLKIKKADNSPGPAIGVGSTSETKIPSRWTSKQFPNMSLWDSPGFNDNRGTQQDITNAFYRYQLLQKVKSLKIILVVDIAAIQEDDIMKFLDVLKDLESLMQDKMRDCFSSISVIFSKAPTYYNDAEVDKTFIKRSLQENILDSKVHVSPVSKDFVRFLIENDKNMGIFRKAKRPGNINRTAINVDIVSAISNTVSVEKSIVQKMNPSISASSDSYLQKAQKLLFSKNTFNDLQNIVRSALESKILHYKSMNRKKMSQSDINKYKQEINSFEKQLSNALDNCERFQEKIEIVQGIAPLIKEQLENHGVNKLITLAQFIDKVLQLKENSFLDFSINAILSSSIAEIQENELYGIQLEKSCTNVGQLSKLRVTGHVLRLSDIESHTCSSDVKIIELFALEKVLIDMDLDFVGKEIQLTIIAPTWEVLASTEKDCRLINLNGLNGASLKENQARNGSETGDKNGEHGIAGLPGGPAGSFYGVANKIINAYKLKVLANGGSGGKGQDGGHGGKGKDGDSYSKSKDSFRCSNSEHLKNWKVDRISHSYNVAYGIGSESKGFIVYGKVGNYGGTGGNGGVEGQSGKKGNIVITELSKPGRNSITISAENGKKGTVGKGGNPGLGGTRGNDTSVHCSQKGFSSFIGVSVHKKYDPSDELNGKPGKPGISHRMRKIAKSARIVQNFPSTVNNYKMFARLHFSSSNSSRKKSVFHFYNVLNTHEKITKFDDKLSLTEEFAGLEKQYFHLNQQVNLSSSYDALKQRIVNYKKRSHNNYSNDNEHTNVVKKLKRYIHRKLNDSITHTLHPVLTNIANGFNTLKETYLEKANEQERVYKTLKLLDTVSREIDESIEEAQYLFNEDLRNAMGDLENTLDQNIDAVLNEITQLKKVATDKQAELLLSREKLKNNVAMKAVFGIAIASCGVLGVINPALGVAATVASTTLTGIETLFSKSDVATKVVEIPKAVKAFTNAIEDFSKINKEKKDKISKMKQDTVLRMASKTTTIFGKNIVNGVLSVNNGLHNTIPKGRYFERNEIYAREEMKVMEILKEAKKEDNKDKVSDCNIALNIVKYLKATSQILDTGSEVVKNFIQDENKVNEVANAITAIRNNLQKLDQFEKSIYTVTQPMLGEMFDFMNSSINNMKSLNKNRLIISKWRVSDTIKNVTFIMQETTKGFNVSSDIQWTFDKVYSLFNVMTKMHEAILNYSEKKSQNEFMASLLIAHKDNLLIKDRNLKLSLSELQTLIEYNKLFLTYDEWIFAFKQFTFPFGATVLENKNIVNRIVDENIYDVVKKVKLNIDNIEEYVVKENKNRELRKYQIREPCMGSKSKSKKSFFVWRNESNEQLISDILSGENRTLVSLVPMNGFNAVKFTALGMQFTSKNAEIQEKLFRVFENFKLTLVHHGDSIYKFKNKVFKIKTAPELLIFGLPDNQEGNVATYSHIHQSLSQGDCMLSPYATWSAKLINKHINQSGFKSLKEFMGKVDLELSGEGYFVDNFDCDKTCENIVEKYYRDTEIKDF